MSNSQMSEQLESERRPMRSEGMPARQPAEMRRNFSVGARPAESSYFPPYSLLSKLIQEDAKDGKGGTVSMPAQVFELLLRDALNANGFDREWYKSAYADVTQAMAKGVIKDEFLHFAQSGYREGRLPRVLEVNEAWYRHRYPDIDKEIKAGRISTAQHHFLTAGYFEGRFPNAAAEEQAGSWISLFYPSK